MMQKFRMWCLSLSVIDERFNQTCYISLDNGNFVETKQEAESDVRYNADDPRKEALGENAKKRRGVKHSCGYLERKVQEGTCQKANLRNTHYCSRQLGVIEITESAMK